ncbi:DUF3991 domain-containing protein [Prevotella brunnea]|uniref:toprim domain-containing protein n=1 Tax=Prevotella brunnea TaxID=2508867 RepID=UPI00281A5DC4|nr:toprim domain-containing protein [Prevotella brunnea]MDR0185327.1 DUF3991 domain-containing protein [Prevotella brunnea]
MREHQVDFKALKAKVGIDDIASSLGYQVDRKAGMGRYIEFVLPDSAGGKKDTIIVSHIHDKSQQTFFRRNGQRGDVINFIQENANSFGVSGRNTWDLISKVMAKFANQPIDETQQRAYIQINRKSKLYDPKLYQTEPILQNMDAAQYIFRQRNIKKETIEDFAPWIQRVKDTRFNSEFVNIGFPYVKPGSDKVEGYEIRGYGSFKRKATGTNSTTAAWIVDFSKYGNPQDIKNVYFAESAYDVMAFYQANKAKLQGELDKSVFVSIGGTFSNQQIGGIMDYYSNARAVDCFDNDIPGRIYGMRMVGVVEKLPLNIIQSDETIKVSYKGKEYVLDAQRATLNSLRTFIPFKRSFGVEKAPAAFKDWNDVIQNKPSTMLLTKSKYERDDNLREKRMGGVKI